jgi:hypothetical protein
MPNVEIIRMLLPTADGKNILFLGDGFSRNDRKLFIDVVEEFKRLFFRFVEPFNLAGQVGGVKESVKGKFNIFAVFTPTLASGISSAWPVNTDGEPVDPDNPDHPNAPSAGNLAEKQSFFNLQFDGRCILPKPDHKRDIINFVQTLTFPIPEIDIRTAIPDCWNAVNPPDPTRPYLGKDKGLIVVLVNDDVDAGNTLGHPDAPDTKYAVAVSISPYGDRFNLTGDGVPNSSGVLEFPHTPVKRDPKKFAGRLRHPKKFNIINDVIAHELGHSRFCLADEYTEEPPSSNAGSPPADYPEPNVTAEDHAQNMIGNFTEVKWKEDMLTEVKNYVEKEGPFYTENCSNPPTNDGWEPPDKRHIENILHGLGLKIQFPLRPIALYEGARLQRCGIYRPAGICKMRATADLLTSGARFRSWPFCYVCKKAIIQDIDPKLTNLLKRKQYYPQPRERNG